MARRVSNAVTKTNPALLPRNSSFNSLRRFPSTGPALVTASISKEPVPDGVMHDEVGHFRSSVNRNAKFRQIVGVQMFKLFSVSPM